MKNWLNYLSSAALVKIAETIKATEVLPKEFVARVQHNLDKNTSISVWLVIEPKISGRGIGWQCIQIWVAPNKYDKPPVFLYDTPIIELLWKDLKKELQFDIVQLESFK